MVALVITPVADAFTVMLPAQENENVPAMADAVCDEMAHWKLPQPVTCGVVACVDAHVPMNDVEALGVGAADGVDCFVLGVVEDECSKLQPTARPARDSRLANATARRPESIAPRRFGCLMRRDATAYSFRPYAAQPICIHANSVPVRSRQIRRGGGARTYRIESWGRGMKLITSREEAEGRHQRSEGRGWSLLSRVIFYYLKTKDGQR